jgi:uncharacterized membrane protein
MPKFASLLIAAMLWPCIASAQVPAAYHATVLGTGTAVAINNKGQVAGIDNAFRAAVWNRDGVATVLPGQVYLPTVQAINDDGTVVGYGLLTDPDVGGNGYYQPLIWRNGGSVQRLDLPGEGGVAAAINNRGDVVGLIATPGSPSGNTGFLQRDSGTLYFQGFQPTAINDAGVVAGNGEHGIAVWRDGALVDVPDGCCSFDERINNDGWIAGTNYVGGLDATLWHDGQRTTLWEGPAYDINDAGMVIGASSTPVLWYQGQAHALDDLWHEPQWADWRVLSVAAINDNAEIAARVYNMANGDSLSVLLSPVPESSGAGMLLAGLGLLGLLARRTGCHPSPGRGRQPIGWNTAGLES